MTNFEKALIARDGMTEADARELAATYLLEGDLDSAYDVCGEWGLEPDYFMDVVPML